MGKERIKRYCLIGLSLVIPLVGVLEWESRLQAQRAEARRPALLSRDLARAVAAGDFHTVRSLLDRGANIQNPNGYFVSLASGGGHTAILKLLLDRGADPNEPKIDGKGGPIIVAAANGHTDTLKLLLDEGAEIKELGATPLIHAAFRGHTHTVNFLLDRGLDINGRDKAGYGYTALMFAACRGHASIVRALLERGADTQLRSKVGYRVSIHDNSPIHGNETALQMAQRYKHTDIGKMLQDWKQAKSRRSAPGIKPS